MNRPLTVKVSKRHQISLPSLARKTLHIEAGDRLLVDVQDGLIILMPEPNDYTAYLDGLHRDVWQDMDTVVYLNEEREAWRTSSNN